VLLSELLKNVTCAKMFNTEHFIQRQSEVYHLLWLRS